jgi:hypothetical protein
MKTMKKTMMALSVLAALITLASGCDQLERGEPAAPETGVLRVVLDGGGQRSLNILRTALPKYDAASLYYTLTFTATGGPAYTEHLGPVNGAIAVGESSGDFTLAAGIWSLDVKGFASEAASVYAANALVSGSAEGIEISGSAGASISVAMIPDESKLTSDATGTLSYDISFPGGVTRGSLAVYDDNGDIVGSPVNLLTANPGSLSLSSGVYDLAISLYMGEKFLARGETVHIRDGLSTSVVWGFLEQDFAEYTRYVITGFTLKDGNEGYAGRIDQAARTVTVFAPSIQDLSSLSAEIDYTGIVVEPDPATGRDYSSPVTYTITLEDGTKISYTARVITKGVSNVTELNSLLDVAAANTADNPLPVKLSAGVNLADSGGNGLADFLSAIAVKEKYVDLDLSDCGMSGTEFNPGATGNLYITGLVLPNVAKSIAAGGGEASSTFNSFTGLRTLSASGLETVNEYAFSYGSGLVSIYLPNVTEIGEHAFVGCDRIETLDLPNVTKIGGYAFSDWRKLKDISLPSAVEIGYYAFGECRVLETVTLPKVTKIGGSAFYNCWALETVSLPKVTEISGSIFEGCMNITTVNLPEVTSIGGNAFASTKLTEVNLPKVISIGGNAFENCGSLTVVSLPEVTSIGGRAFAFTKLTAVSLPKVTEISGSIFEGCEDLATVNLPLATSIGDSAFASTKLTGVNLPKAVSIGKEAFKNCWDLATVNLPEVTSIGDDAFSGCEILVTVSLPKVTSIGSAFASCRNLVSISLPEVTSIGTNAFKDCSNLETVVLSKVISIGESAFWRCTSLVSISLPEVTTIGSFAFDGCTNLAEVNLPKVTSIGESAFKSTGGQELTLSLGAAAPTVDVNLFYTVSEEKDLTVNVPPGASGYGSSPVDTTTQNWGNAFRGMGWNGEAYQGGAANPYIKLTIQSP